MNRLRGTFSVNRGPVWLRLGTCPPLSTVTLAALLGRAQAGRPGTSLSQSLGAKASGEGGHGIWGRIWGQKPGRRPRGHGVQPRLSHRRALQPSSSLCLGIL